MKDNHKIVTKSGTHQIVCPWWFCFTFDNPLRKVFQNPEKILKPYIKTGMTILETGPGMGYFTIPLAKLTGRIGRVLAVDLQQKMLDGIYRRAYKAGVQEQIKLIKCTPDTIGIKEPVDFSLVFWMLHEVPDKYHFLREIANVLVNNGQLLLVEPKLHVSQKNFQEAVEIAEKIGLWVEERPRIFFSYAVLLRKHC
jgi:ubiquinone/menaquinone biosynthesis C-methylase UbiE